jgi:hypothetical protein
VSTKNNTEKNILIENNKDTCNVSLQKEYIVKIPKTAKKQDLIILKEFLK